MARSDTAALCEQRKRPTRGLAPSRTSLTVLTAYGSPKRATSAVHRSPRRSSCSASERVRSERTSSVSVPVARRNWSAVRPSPWAVTVTCGEAGSRLARAIRPTFRWGSWTGAEAGPPETNSTCAWRMKSPSIAFQAKCSSSLVPQTLAPEAVSV